jgi:hypothetical protein
MELRTKTEADAIFNRIKNVAVKYGKSKKFIEFVMSRKVGRNSEQFHHVFGSYTSKKTTDFLGVAVNGQEHLNQHGNREWLFECIPEAIDNLLAYVEMLEEENLVLRRKK